MREPLVLDGRLNRVEDLRVPYSHRGAYFTHKCTNVCTQHVTHCTHKCTNVCANRADGVSNIGPDIAVSNSSWRPQYVLHK
jgi:hypothetical protein